MEFEYQGKRFTVPDGADVVGNLYSIAVWLGVTRDEVNKLTTRHGISPDSFDFCGCPLWGLEKCQLMRSTLEREVRQREVTRITVNLEHHLGWLERCQVITETDAKKALTKAKRMLSRGATEDEVMDKLQLPEVPEIELDDLVVA